MQKIKKRNLEMYFFVNSEVEMEILNFLHLNEYNIYIY